MNIIRIIFFAVVGAFLFSCSKELKINADALPIKLVVDGKIEINAPPQVILRKSGFLYDTINIEDSYVHNAVIEVSDGSNTVQLTEICYKIYYKIDSLLDNNDTLTGQELALLLIDVQTEEEMDSIYYYYYGLESDDLEQSLLLCAYVGIPTPGSTPIFGEEGKTYTLKVTDGAEVVTATTTIPELFAVDSLSYVNSAEAPGYSEVFINLNFPVNNVLGHYIQYGSKTSGTPFFYGMRTGSVYSDAVFEGSTSLTLPLEGPKNADDGRPEAAERLYENGDTVTLIWKNIDKATYEYLYSTENDGGSTPFSAPTKIRSNINGGLGVWAGYNISFYSVYVPL